MSTKRDFIKKVAKIQKEINCGKSQFNKFGNYFHRNIEDIMEAIKPHLGELMLNINEDVVMIGERFYIKSTATLTDGEHEVSSTALAREPETVKGMSEPQISGASGSYASKYSLGKLLLLDDNKDADSNEITELTKGKSTKPDKPSRFTRTKKTEKVEEVEPSNEVEEEETPVESKVEQEEKPTPSKTSFRRFTRGNK